MSKVILTLVNTIKLTNSTCSRIGEADKELVLATACAMSELSETVPAWRSSQALDSFFMNLKRSLFVEPEKSPEKNTYYREKISI